MKSYESGDELAAEITKRGGLFIGEFADVPDDGWDRLVDGVDRTPRQMIAYQLGWMELLLGWERDERAGKEVITPAPGYKWNQLGGLYESFYQRWSKEKAITAMRERLILGSTFLEKVNEIHGCSCFQS